MNSMTRLNNFTPRFAFGIMVLGSLCSVGAQGAGLSSHTGRPAMEIINVFDTDNDGRISREELRYRSIAVFDEIDKSKDGMLSPAELPGLSAATFNAADKDNDGKLSAYEYSQSEFLRFGTIDKDNDGFITAAEISAFQDREKSQ